MLDACGLALAGSLQQACDVGQQHGRPIGLRKVTIGSEFHAHDLVELGVGGGEHEEGDIARPTYRAADAQAVGAWKPQVEDDGVGTRGERLLRSVCEVLADERLMAVQLEHVGKLAAEGFVVLDDEYFAHIAPLHAEAVSGLPNDTTLPQGHAERATMTMGAAPARCPAAPAVGQQPVGQ